MTMNYILLLIGLLVFLSGTALWVIDSTHESRLLFRKIQDQEKILDDYRIEWGQLQLEFAMLRGEDRVESIAKNKLNLRMPIRKQIIYVRP